MEIWWKLAIALLVLWLVFRFVRTIFSPRTPSDPVEDPLAGVPSPTKRGPPQRSGAVALAEPDEDDEGHAFPPRVR